jgi:hypothetical protein
MRDSVTLAWKFDLVLRGLVGPDFLDTYFEERYPHARANVVDSVELGKLATERDPEKAAARDAFLLSGQAPPPPPDPILTTGVLLRSADGEPVKLAGELAPQGNVHYNGVTSLFDDAVGWGFHLVAKDRDPSELLDDEQRRFFESIHGFCVGVSTEERPGLAIDVNWTYKRYFEENGIEAFLMRPDYYLFATFASIDEIPAAVDALREQLGYSAPAELQERTLA